jgi:hypothetical protein
MRSKLIQDGGQQIILSQNISRNNVTQNRERRLT